MADNKPTNRQKIRPPGCGDSGGVGRGPAPRGSVPLRRKAGGSRADRQLSAACVAEYGVRRFKTDAHPALHTICRKRRSDRTPERDDIAVLISTRNPAGCKSRKNAKGRSSDSFRFRAFPALRPVAKIAEPLAPRGAGTHSNGYCRRFSLHSLFIPTSARPGGCVAETFATQR